ncbi:MAG TPA: guanylate kinase [Candidatus Binatia bacterium]|nr:guanylate kinase [Candidatus Binatia bacterium]
MNPSSRSPVRRHGIIFILSAPSGAGKTTLYNGLRKIHPEVKLSVSCTTRARRPGEVDGRDYHFLTEREFSRMQARGGFAEWAKVHDYHYGTPRRPLDQSVRAGRDILLDIDVQGARQIKRAYPGAVSIFLLPPSMAELKRRLSARGTDDREIIRRRLANARGEIQEIIHYDYYVINREVGEAVRLLSAIVEAERAKTSRVIEWRLEPLRRALGRKA